MAEDKGKTLDEIDPTQIQAYYQMLMDAIVENGIRCNAESIIALLTHAYMGFAMSTKADKDFGLYASDMNTLYSFIEFSGVVLATVLKSTDFDTIITRKVNIPS